MSKSAVKLAESQEKDFAEWIFKYYSIHYKIGFFIYSFICVSYIAFDYLLAPNLLFYSLLIRLYIGAAIFFVAFILSFTSFYRKNFLLVNTIVSSVIPFSLMILFLIFEKNHVSSSDLYFLGVCLQVILIGLFVYKWRITFLTTFTLLILYLILRIFINNEPISHITFSGTFLLTVCITAVIISYHYQEIKTKMFLAEIKISEENIQIEKNRTIIEDQKNELEKINRSKDKLFSIIAHDLRSPFNGLINLSEIYMEDFNSISKQDLFKFLKATNESSNRLYDLLNELLIWAGSISGKMVLNIKDVSLYDIIYENINLLSNFSETKKLNITSDIREDMFIRCDKMMIDTVLRNLLYNAIKFTNKNGSIRINCSVDSEKCTIAVTDNGVGISDVLIDKIFKIDEKTSNIGTDGEKGTGLGLILSKEFIERHNGTIWVESKLGEGSTFSFTIPSNLT